jgi:mannose-6-phosphate isomerase-like protein (cupin superfamily)
MNNTGMPIITAEEAPTFQLDGTHVVGLAAPSRGAVHTSAWRLTLAPGAASPPHALTHEEVFVALRGRLEARYGDRVEEVSAGGALIVPAGATFTLANPGDEPFEAVAMLPVGGRATVAGEEMTPPWAV